MREYVRFTPLSKLVYGKKETSVKPRLPVIIVQKCGQISCGGRTKLIGVNRRGRCGGVGVCERQGGSGGGVGELRC